MHLKVTGIYALREKFLTILYVVQTANISGFIRAGIKGRGA
jgi:hypothetical protein